MRNYQEYTLLDAAAATGAGKAVLVNDFRHAVVSINTSGSANLTVKFAGSIQEPAPNFGSAQSVANSYDFLQIKDLEDGSSIDGDTGFALAGTDDHRLFEVNINAIKYFCPVVTARSAGKVTVKLLLTNNN